MRKSLKYPNRATLLQGKPWRSAIAGHEIGAADEEKERQRLLLERFQEEVSITQRLLLTFKACDAVISQIKMID